MRRVPRWSMISRVLGRVGEQVGVHLRQQADIDHDRELLLVHVHRPVHGDMGRAEPAGVVLQLGDDHLPLDEAAPRMEHQVAAFEMLAPKQALDEQAHVGVVLDQFLVVLEQILLQGLQAGAAPVAAARFGPAAVAGDLPLEVLDGGDLLLQLIEQVLEVHVGHNHVVLDVDHQGVDELQTVDVLPGNEPVVQVVADAVGVLGEKEPVGLGQPAPAADRVHARVRSRHRTGRPGDANGAAAPGRGRGFPG